MTLQFRRHHEAPGSTQFVDEVFHAGIVNERPDIHAIFYVSGSKHFAAVAVDELPPKVCFLGPDGEPVEPAVRVSRRGDGQRLGRVILHLPTLKTGQQSRQRASKFLHRLQIAGTSLDIHKKYGLFVRDRPREV